jgi:DNA (cytosine-5)-methyltransferase 1
MGKFNYRWSFNDYPEHNGLKVFSCFACGGGSTMGYKLAGYDVVGCNEIDNKMMELYKFNHHPRYAYLEDIRSFKSRNDLPDELYNLDILDGSPPCSSFSMSGERESGWGKEKQFREGQVKQTLDDLFFDFIDLANKLQPKIVIAENVKGLLLGDAIKYVQKIITGFESAGYAVEKWLLDSSKMGVPQKRERVFFVALRNDIAKLIPGNRHSMFSNLPYLDLEFNENPITFGEIRSEFGDVSKHNERWELVKQRIPSDKTCNDINLRLHDKVSGFNAIIVHDNEVMPTIPAGETTWRDFDGEACSISDYGLCGAFPVDYNYLTNNVKYVIGMSVPPLMIAQIATRIKEQWLDKIEEDW